MCHACLKRGTLFNLAGDDRDSLSSFFLSLFLNNMTFVENFPEGFFFIRCKEAPMAMDVHGGGMTVKSLLVGNVAF